MSRAHNETNIKEFTGLFKNASQNWYTYFKFHILQQKKPYMQKYAYEPD